MDSNILYNLLPFINTDTSFNRSDFDPGILNLFSIYDKQYMTPSAIKVPLLSYNKNIWLNKGLLSPSPKWNWRSLISSAEQVSQKQAEKTELYGFYDGNNGFNVLLAELATSNLYPFSTNFDVEQLSSPEFVAVLESLNTLIDSGAVLGAPPEGIDIRQLIAEERVAIWEYGLFSATSSDWQPPFEIGVLPLPEAPFLYSSVTSSTEGYVMSAGTQHPEEAWQ